MLTLADLISGKTKDKRDYLPSWHPSVKPDLTNKQRKARAKSKRARKARRKMYRIRKA